MRRKILGWREYQPPREWFPKLECGHKQRQYDESGHTDEEQAELDKDGFYYCYDCDRLEAQAKKLEEEAAAIRKRLASLNEGGAPDE